MFLKAVNITKTYTDMAAPVKVLCGVNFELGAGDVAGILGASGSGKSTLLHILGGLDVPTDGQVYSNGNNLGEMKPDELAHFRNRELGFVFQFYHLLPEFSALENTMMPALISGMPSDEAEGIAVKALELVGLLHRLYHRPAMLSGGEQQRVALARAQVMSPRLILADEPTGNLDSATGEQVIEHLLNLNSEKSIAIVLVTHNRDLIQRLPKAYELSDGRLVEIRTGK